MAKTTYLDLLAEYGIDNAHPGGSMLTKRLLRKETIDQNTTLLDAGCGTGMTSIYIRSHYPCTVVAIDINPKMLEKAEQNFKKYQLDIPLIQADVMELPFRKNSFDIILAESVTIFTQIRKSLKEYFRVLKPGGVLLDIETTALIPLAEDETNDFRDVLGVSYLPTKDTWCKMFQDAGFSNVQVLSQERFGPVWTLFPQINRAFHKYFNLMRNYHKKIVNGVYRCTV